MSQLCVSPANAAGRASAIVSHAGGPVKDSLFLPSDKAVNRETLAKPLSETGFGSLSHHAGVRRSAAISSALVVPPGTTLAPSSDRDINPLRFPPELTSGLLTFPEAFQPVVETVEAAAVPSSGRPGEQFFETDDRPVVLFDGVCNLCNKWVNFLLDFDPNGNLRFASLQSEAGKQLLLRSGKEEDDHTDIVFVGKNKSYVGSHAVLEILARLKLPFPLIAMAGRIVPPPLHHHIYKAVSENRYNMFGVSDACRLFDSRFGERFLQ